MASRVTWSSTLSMASAFFLLFAAGPTADAIDEKSWDMAVALGSEIHFFKNGKMVENSTVANISDITALSYDGANRTLYMSGKNKNDHVLSSCNLDKKNLTALHIHPCKNQDAALTGSQISKMVFDPETKALFLLHNASTSFWKMEVADNGTCTKLDKLHHGQDTALDIRHRFVYWAASNSTASSVQRSKLDDIKKIEIFDESIFPVGRSLAVDQDGGKLYFAGNKTATKNNYTIEERDLDGKKRTVLAHDIAEIPEYLVVDKNTVYWTDLKSIWKLEKNGTAKTLVKSYSSETPGGNKFGGIVIRGNNEAKNAGTKGAGTKGAGAEGAGTKGAGAEGAGTKGAGAKGAGFSTLPGVTIPIVIFSQTLKITKFLY